MNSAIAEIIRAPIATLPFIIGGKSAGLVVPITVSELVDSKTVNKTFPVGCGVTQSECLGAGKLTELMPNSNYNSVSYFEDLGVNIVGEENHYFDFESRLKFVCWLNKKKLGTTSCSVSALAIGAILKVLPNPNFNSTPFTRIIVTMVGQDIKSNAIFSKYTYNEQQTQYLMHPYDYFAITLKTTFRLPYQCIDEWVSGLPINCDNAIN